MYVVDYFTRLKGLAGERLARANPETIRFAYGAAPAGRPAAPPGRSRGPRSGERYFRRLRRDRVEACERRVVELDRARFQVRL